MARNLYRKWYNQADDEEHYLLIHPNGVMLELVFETDFYGTKITVYQSNRHNRMNPDVFKKYKEVCAKADWDKAVERAVNLARAKLIDLELFARKKGKVLTDVW